MASEGKNDAEIAREPKIHIDMVRRWRQRWFNLEVLALEDLTVEVRLEDLPHRAHHLGLRLIRFAKSSRWPVKRRASQTVLSHTGQAGN